MWIYFRANVLLPQYSPYLRRSCDLPVGHVTTSEDASEEDTRAATNGYYGHQSLADYVDS